MNAFSSIDPKKPHQIEHYNSVVATIFELYLRKFKREMLKDALSAELSGTGVSVRKSWIEDLRRGHPIAYANAHKVFVATNNLLAKLDGPQIPDSALMEAPVEVK